MSQGEKKLLLKDLCARLPHGVKYQTYLGDIFTLKDITLSRTTTQYYIDDNAFNLSQIKPYLRPMSSMTDEEKKELKDICTMYNSEPTSSYEHFGIEVFHISRYGTNFETDYTVIDWLNSHHFDYRRLIEKGLALEAPEGMYNIK